MNKNATQKRWNLNLLDIFIIMLVIIAGLAVYFTVVRPVQFSHLIQREAVSQYAEVDLLLSPDISWLKELLPVGEDYKNVYGVTEWKILDKGDELLGGKSWARLKVKVLVVKESSGFFHYGRYTLVVGGSIHITNDNFTLSGLILRFHLLNEKVSM